MATQALHWLSPSSSALLLRAYFRPSRRKRRSLNGNASAGSASSCQNRRRRQGHGRESARLVAGASSRIHTDVAPTISRQRSATPRRPRPTIKTTPPCTWSVLGSRSSRRARPSGVPRLARNGHSRTPLRRLSKALFPTSRKKALFLNRQAITPFGFLLFACTPRRPLHCSIPVWLCIKSAWSWTAEPHPTSPHSSSAPPDRQWRNKRSRKFPPPHRIFGTETQESRTFSLDDLNC